MKISETMRKALNQYETAGHWEGVNPRTLRALRERGLIQPLSDGQLATTALAEQIGVNRPNRLALRWHDAFRLEPDYDAQPGDYAFYDTAFRAKARGLELGGLLLKPLASKIAAWVLGLPPRIRYDDEETEAVINEWWIKNHAEFIQALEEASRYGDMFLVVNADETVTLIPPHVMYPVVDPNDYSRWIGWQIRTVHANPNNFADVMQFEDTYTADEHIRVVRKGGSIIRQERWRNLTGICQVIHIPNNRSSNERYGRSDGESLITALQYYGEVLEAAITGNIKQGRPTPAFTQLGSAQSVEKFLTQFGRERERMMPDGTVERFTEIDFSADDAVFLGESGQFRYESPGSFTADTERILGLIFYLTLQHTEFPEFIWGNAIASSKASADTQMPPFIKFIEKRQGQDTKWVLQVVRLIAAIKALSDPKVRASEEPRIMWQALTTRDQRLTLDALEFATSNGLIDRRTALQLAPLDIENVDEVIERAERERQETDASFERQADAALRQAQAAMNGGDDMDDEPDMTNRPRNEDDQRLESRHKPAATVLREGA